MESKVALVTGVAGQDGSYLAELLVGKGYDVHGVVRRYSVPNFPNLRGLLGRKAITLHEGDLGDYHSLASIVRETKPDECYNLAAQSHVGASFTQPTVTFDVTGLGAVRLFQAVREHAPRARVYQASSSEMMGNTKPQAPDGRLDEEDHFEPASPYGGAKVFAHQQAHVFRRAYGTFISNGQLFNHESERRGVNFVTRKVTLGLARICHGLQDKLELGALDARRDWGYAPEYCDAMWRMLQQDEPGDFVVATGVDHSVREWVDEAVAWYRRGDPGWDPKIVVSQTEKRPYDVDRLVGNPAKAKRVLGWEAKTSFTDLVAKMAKHDYEAVLEEALRVPA